MGTQIFAGLQAEGFSSGPGSGRAEAESRNLWLNFAKRIFQSQAPEKRPGSRRNPSVFLQCRISRGHTKRNWLKENSSESATPDADRRKRLRARVRYGPPHDLRRTCAACATVQEANLEQIQFLLGHVSVQTPERYVGSKQKLQDAVNDRLGISVAGETALKVSSAVDSGCWR
jgi:integrase